MGKGALVYISLGPQYAALGNFSAWFFVVFQAVYMVVAVAQSAVSQLFAGRRGGERSVGLYFFRASVRSVRHFFRLVFRCFSSCVYGGCRSAIGSFAVVCRALKGWGKERWSIISLGPQYAALGNFSAWFFVVFQAVYMVVAVAQSAVSQLSAGR